ESGQAVERFLKGMEQDNIKLVLEGVRQNRHALRTVGEQAKAEIETLLLGELCNITEQFSGAGKPSGAGGGDCGIAFIPSHISAKDLQRSWEKSGIRPLEIQICYQGANEI